MAHSRSSRVLHPRRTQPRAGDPQPGPSTAAPSRMDSEDDEPVASCCGLTGPRAPPPDVNEVDTWPIDAPYYPEDEINELEAVEMVERLLRAHRATGPAFLCASCRGVLRLPVTGACGHSRCRACVRQRPRCPCGEPRPDHPAIDVLVQHLLSSMTIREAFARVVMDLRMVNNNDARLGRVEGRRVIFSAPPSPSGRPRRLLVELRDEGHAQNNSDISRHARALLPTPEGSINQQRRYIYARSLVRSGRRAQPRPHLARCAAHGHKVIRRRAKKMLVQLWGMVRPQYAAIARAAARRWLQTGELDCIICVSHYRCPVTTPCGHTYCRSCLERSRDYQRFCPLCSRDLVDFNIDATCDNAFIMQAVEASGACAIELPDTDERLPIFVCTVAFPTVPCPLYVFEPRYRLMIRRCMRSQTKQFGMVASDSSKTYSDCGTILEIRDCVWLSDGCSILTTIGISRFRILQREMRDGYDVARFELITDTWPSTTMYRAFSRQIRDKAVRWLRHMDRDAQDEIEATFGPMPPEDQVATLGRDGPAWMWWVLAILPLANDLKVMILSTPLLEKRMMAVERTLDTMSHMWRPTPRALLRSPMLQRAA